MAIARALAMEPMLMLFDEPTSALDVADWVTFMDQGVVVESGHAADVIDNPSTERARQFFRRMQ